MKNPMYNSQMCCNTDLDRPSHCTLSDFRCLNKMKDIQKVIPYYPDNTCKSYNPMFYGVGYTVFSRADNGEKGE